MIFEDLVCERNNTILVGIKFYMPEKLFFFACYFLADRFSERDKIPV